MKINLMILSEDMEYLEFLSDYLSKERSDVFEIAICTKIENATRILETSNYDLILIEDSIYPKFSADRDYLTVIFGSNIDRVNSSDVNGDTIYINKYQRISKMSSQLLEFYGVKNPSNVGISSGKANITVSWSPCGGVGSTTVALAYALNKTENKKNALYINMEPLSSLSYYFQDSDKGLSYALQKLDSNINNILLSLIQNDSYTGINYIDSVDNYNDLNIVSVDEIDKLISALSTNAEEIIIDLSSQTGEVAQAILERANNILLVVDNKPVSNVKLNCFIKQHNIFNKVKRNITLVNNQNAGINVADIDRTISLPRINQNEPSNVFKELSKYFQKGN